MSTKKKKHGILKKTSVQRAIPTQLEVNNLRRMMTMNQIRDTTTFKLDMPKSVHVPDLGRSVPKSALRGDHLAYFYLLYGGAVIPKPKRKLKHFSVSRTKTSIEKKHDKLLERRSKDHGSKKKLSLSHEPSKAVFTKGSLNKQKRKKQSGENEEYDLLEHMNRLRLSNKQPQPQAQEEEEEEEDELEDALLHFEI